MIKSLALLAVVASPLLGAFAAKDDTAVANRKWVREALRGLVLSSQTIQQDDELHCDGTNCWVNVLAERDGVITNVPYFFDFSVRTVYGDRVGAIVVESDNPSIPEGTLLAKCNGENYVNRTKKVIRSSGGLTADLGYLFDLDIVIESHDESFEPYTNVCFAASETDRGWAKRKITSEKSHSSQYIRITETITVNGTIETYRYTLSGILLFEDEHTDICGGSSSTGTPDAWSIRSSAKRSRQNLVLSPVTSAAKRPFSILSLLVPTAYAAEPRQEVVSPLPLRDHPLVDWVDTFTYAPEGVTKETHWPLPAETVPAFDQWYDPNRWFQDYPDHMPLVVYVDITLENGQIIKNKPTKIRSVEALEKLGVEIVKYHWCGVDFVEKAELCEFGHIYGENCICIVCGEVKREHVYGFDYVKENQCARCKNLHDDWSENKWGEKRPNGRKLETVCNAQTETGDPALHRGWHATEHESDDNYYCDCECGFYHAVEPLSHVVGGDFDTEENPAVWTDKGDGLHHYVHRPCARDCGGHVEFRQDHKIDVEAELPEGEERTSRPVEDEELYAHFHLIKAACTANGCTFIGEVQEEHRFKGDSCYCETCRITIHDYQPFPCGAYENYYCDRCDAENYDPKKPLKHKFIPGDDPNVHYCECGREKGPHVWVLEGNNYVCKICGQVSNDHKSRYRCRYKSKNNTAEKHLESDEGVFPDDPDESNGKTCSYCKRTIVDDIPEAHQVSIQEAFGCEPDDVPFCWYSVAGKWSTVKNHPLGITAGSTFWHDSERTAGFGTTFSFIAETANSWIEPSVSLAKRSKVGMWELYQIHYPYARKDFNTATQHVNFVSNCLKKPTQEELVYSVLEYFCEIKEDESGTWGAHWK